MRCPVDNQPLRACRYEGVAVHTCDRCQGELVPGDALARVINIREERFDPELLRLVESSEPIFGVPVSERERTLECPACDTPMNVINYASDSGVFVDRCPACHAIWLDPSELEKVQALLEQWESDAPDQLRAIAHQLDDARSQAAQDAGASFNASRFSFVNALINRLLDAA